MPNRLIIRKKVLYWGAVALVVVALALVAAATTAKAVVATWSATCHPDGSVDWCAADVDYCHFRNGEWFMCAWGAGPKCDSYPAGWLSPGDTFGVGLSDHHTIKASCGGGGGGAPTINNGPADMWATIFGGTDDQGKPDVQIYCIDLAGNGYFGMQVTQADIANAVPTMPPASNTLVKLTDKCLTPVSFYVLTTGEYQINIGPDAQGKTHVTIFTGFPPSNLHFQNLDPHAP